MFKTWSTETVLNPVWMYNSPYAIFLKKKLNLVPNKNGQMLPSGSSWDGCKDKCETTGCVDQRYAEMRTANLKQVSSFSIVSSTHQKNFFLLLKVLQNHDITDYNWKKGALSFMRAHYCTLVSFLLYITRAGDTLILILQVRQEQDTGNITIRNLVAAYQKYHSRWIERALTQHLEPQQSS